MENSKNFELKNADSRLIANEAVRVLLEKKALDVRLFNVIGKTNVTDFYVNATGRSSMQVAALSDYVDELLSNKGCAPLRIEGRAGNAWILVDYGDVIVNIFDKASREFYSFDRHLPEDSELDITDLIKEVDEKLQINKAEE
ncbi:MAG: ribosome silencing factor [Clostridia bacterium]|nr:ribosome silencing factor [Clostridia bacterium]